MSLPEVWRDGFPMMVGQQMKCRLFMQGRDGLLKDLGFFAFANEDEACRVAGQKLDDAPGAMHIDVWVDGGELFRVARSSTAEPP